MNFVVDDIVKGISDNYCITDMDMTRGRILSVHGDEIEVRVMSHKSNPFCLGASYVVEAQYFEKIGHIKPFNREEVLELIAKGNQNKLNEYDFYGANLRSANLRSADLRSADLSGANLLNVRYDECTGFFALVCPEEGSFIGYKKANGHIVKLRITEDALRSSATSRKCRCSKAEVLSITTLDGKDDGLTSIPCNYDSNFIYRVGTTVEVEDFETDRWDECAAGIHFFITRQEAVQY